MLLTKKQQTPDTNGVVVKRQKLKEFDRVIQDTLHFDGQQAVEQRQKVKPFASLTTLKALRVTIKTVGDIVDSISSQ
ncbi:hypothetical protein DAPPUDRAFT_258132 [Daphnia pulex]|uniref:Uncharacterized protein n=1 Tax=Daphnia pulex TaxID=6669 RepID=E9HET4_DAPPU|nr:hypothetical protein DAPPUDRAFT_258132 [Daphnia pulex]|eukprot:EFX69758.1 hypothetical protein DAPPUDRAFT_258132 [Daphnia pulex]